MKVSCRNCIGLSTDGKRCTRLAVADSNGNMPLISIANANQDCKFWNADYFAEALQSIVVSVSCKGYQQCAMKLLRADDATDEERNAIIIFDRFLRRSQGAV